MNAPVVCASGVDLLTEFLEGVLPAGLGAQLESHVAGCERCAAFVRSFRETPRIVREATLTPVPTGLEVSVMDFLRRQRG